MAKILTIEDDLVTAREIMTELQAGGNVVEHVADGREGLNRALAGGYDAITLDRMLPGLDGLAVVTELRSAGIDTPVLMIRFPEIASGRRNPVAPRPVTVSRNFRSDVSGWACVSRRCNRPVRVKARTGTAFANCRASDG